MEKTEANVARKIAAGFLLVSLLVTIGLPIQLGNDAIAKDTGQIDGQPGYWPMERGNSQRNGTSVFNISVLKPHTIWDVDLTDMAGWNKSIFYVSTVFSCVADDGTIYLANSENVSAIYPNGTLRWTIGLSETPFMSPTTGGNGDLYVGTSFDGNMAQEHHTAIYAISPNGTIKWRVQLPEINPRLLVDDSNTIYASVSSYDPVDQHNITVTSKVLVAVASNGSILWNYSIPVASGSGGVCIPAIAPDGTIRFQTEATLRAINKNGTTKWAFDLPSRGPYERNDPLVTDNGSTISICNRTLLSISNEGELQWSYELQTSSSLFNRWLIYSDHTIYIIDSSGILEAIRDNGTHAWTRAFDGGAFYGPAMSRNGLILILNNNAQLMAITANGTTIWETDPLYSESGGSGPTEIVIGAEDRIYIRHNGHGESQSVSLMAVGYEVWQPIDALSQNWVLIGFAIVLIAVVGGILLWRTRR